ncbi:hypothetical protein [Cytobacillus sp. IB215316]|uniref:hypothetical protein n=1 Tax=Cytobacillus sp. IB215316 TaxID=3097354 RepID=UPI002A14B472|nr:hypothetical protein [Cytobacillus sp. IB215316]MDX8361716.1 hypothetical protein [Cytobacillus sp. IB215316]
MEFVKAEDLKRLFSVKASFYNVEIGNQVFECRNYAQIYHKNNIIHSHYDAVFVLVNPGLCSPKYPTYQIPHYNKGSIPKNFTPANIDNTQYQIMRFMLLKQWDNILIINLSDIRAGNISTFKQVVSEAYSKGFEKHSIFSSQRKEELKDVLVRCQGPIILGWGINPIVKSLAKKAYASLPLEKIIGIEHKERPFYYHPSPTLLKGKIKWLKEMNERIS